MQRYLLIFVFQTFIDYGNQNYIEFDIYVMLAALATSILLKFDQSIQSNSIQIYKFIAQSQFYKGSTLSRFLKNAIDIISYLHYPSIIKKSTYMNRDVFKLSKSINQKDSLHKWKSQKQLPSMRPSREENSYIINLSMFKKLFPFERNQQTISKQKNKMIAARQQQSMRYSSAELEKFSLHSSPQKFSWSKIDQYNDQVRPFFKKIQEMGETSANKLMKPKTQKIVDIGSSSNLKKTYQQYEEAERRPSKNGISQYKRIESLIVQESPIGISLQKKLSIHRIRYKQRMNLNYQKRNEGTQGQALIKLSKIELKRKDQTEDKDRKKRNIFKQVKIPQSEISRPEHYPQIQKNEKELLKQIDQLQFEKTEQELLKSVDQQKFKSDFLEPNKGKTKMQRKTSNTNQSKEYEEQKKSQQLTSMKHEKYQSSIYLNEDMNSTQRNEFPALGSRLDRYQQILKIIEQKKQSNSQKATFNLPNISQSNLDQIENRKSFDNSQINATDPLRKSALLMQYAPINLDRLFLLQTENKNRQKFSQKGNVSKTQIKSLVKIKQLKKGYLSYEDQKLQTFWKTIYQTRKQKNQDIDSLDLSVKKPIPGVAAKSYLVLHAQTLRPLAIKNPCEYIQIASLTKIMTCYLCILACKKYQIDMESFTVRISDRAAQMPGTSGQLQAGDLLTIQQLLYGLMLPSGNDASVAIAEAIGKIIQNNKKSNGYSNQINLKNGYQTFINHMNLFAEELDLQQQFQNSSGLSQHPNFSTPFAIASLTSLAIKNPIFRKIVNTKTYQLQIRNQRFGLIRTQKWKNTNKLLWRQSKNETIQVNLSNLNQNQSGSQPSKTQVINSPIAHRWQGVKTGTTLTAGHCLMAYKNNHIICVFGSQTLSKRFLDCQKIYQFLTVKD